MSLIGRRRRPRTGEVFALFDDEGLRLIDSPARQWPFGDREEKRNGKRPRKEGQTIRQHATNYRHTSCAPLGRWILRLSCREWIDSLAAPVRVDFVDCPFRSRRTTPGLRYLFCAFPGAKVFEPAGEGIRVAALTDPFGNIFGIIENPHLLGLNWEKRGPAVPGSRHFGRNPAQSFHCRSSASGSGPRKGIPQ